VKLWKYLQGAHVCIIFLAICRCRKSADFSLKCAWLLDAYSSDAHLPSKKKSHGTKLKNLILSDELRPKEADSTLTRRSRVSTGGPAPDCSKMKELASPALPSGPPPAPPLPPSTPVTSPNKKTHQRSWSDATGLYPGHRRMLSSGNFLCLKYFHT
jgi:phosphatidylinositol 4-kinase